jgi:hypothetical protein
MKDEMVEEGPQTGSAGFEASITYPACGSDHVISGSGTLQNEER